MLVFEKKIVTRFFEVRYLENDISDPPFLLHGLIEGVKIYIMGKY